MAVIAMPASVRIAEIEWEMDDPAQVNRSQWSGTDQVIDDVWYSRWSAKAMLAPILGEANVLDWRAFLALVKGRKNSFRLIAVENAQIGTGFTTLVSGSHAQGATSLAVSGFPAGTFAKGRFVTVNDQLLMVTSAATISGGGTGTLTLHTPLRAAAANGTAIEARYPTAHVALASSARGWSVGKGQLYGISLEVEERF